LPAANVVEKMNTPSATRSAGLHRKCNHACYLRDAHAITPSQASALRKNRFDFLSVLPGPLDGESEAKSSVPTPIVRYRLREGDFQ
jgi:hypothetical protein